MLYSVRSIPHGHRITKFDELVFVLASYEVKGLSCSCPARAGCKHPAMVRTFVEFNMCDTGAFWDAEGERWIPPLEATP